MEIGIVCGVLANPDEIGHGTTDDSPVKPHHAVHALENDEDLETDSSDSDSNTEDISKMPSAEHLATKQPTFPVAETGDLQEIHIRHKSLDYQRMHHHQQNSVINSVFSHPSVDEVPSVEESYPAKTHQWGARPLSPRSSKSTIPRSKSPKQTYSPSRKANVENIDQKQHAQSNLNADEDELKVFIWNLVKKKLDDNRPVEIKLFDAVIVYHRSDYVAAMSLKEEMTEIAKNQLGEGLRIELFDDEVFSQSKVLVVEDVTEKCSLILVYLTANFMSSNELEFFIEEAIGKSRFTLPGHGHTFEIKPVHTLPKDHRNYKTPPGFISAKGIDWFDRFTAFTNDKIVSVLSEAMKRRKQQEKAENTKQNFKHALQLTPGMHERHEGIPYSTAVPGQHLFHVRPQQPAQTVRQHGPLAYDKNQHYQLNNIAPSGPPPHQHGPHTFGLPQYLPAGHPQQFQDPYHNQQQFATAPIVDPRQNQFHPPRPLVDPRYMNQQTPIDYQHTVYQRQGHFPSNDQPIQNYHTQVPQLPYVPSTGDRQQLIHDQVFNCPNMVASPRFNTRYQSIPIGESKLPRGQMLSQDGLVSTHPSLRSDYDSSNRSQDTYISGQPGSELSTDDVEVDTAGNHGTTPRLEKQRTQMSECRGDTGSDDDASDDDDNPLASALTGKPDGSVINIFGSKIVQFGTLNSVTGNKEHVSRESKQHSKSRRKTKHISLSCEHGDRYQSHRADSSSEHINSPVEDIIPAESRNFKHAEDCKTKPTDGSKLIGSPQTHPVKLDDTDDSYEQFVNDLDGHDSDSLVNDDSDDVLICEQNIVVGDLKIQKTSAGERTNTGERTNNGERTNTCDAHPTLIRTSVSGNYEDIDDSSLHGEGKKNGHGAHYKQSLEKCNGDMGNNVFEYSKFLIPKVFHNSLKASSIDTVSTINAECDELD